MLGFMRNFVCYYTDHFISLSGVYKSNTTNSGIVELFIMNVAYEFHIHNVIKK